MAKYVCQVCGYVYEGDAAPAECPICHAPLPSSPSRRKARPGLLSM